MAFGQARRAQRPARQQAGFQRNPDRGFPTRGGPRPAARGLLVASPNPLYPRNLVAPTTRRTQLAAINQNTSTRCPGCGNAIPARRVVRAGDLYLASDCPDCGPHEMLFFRDAALYERLAPHAPGSLRCRGEFACVEGRPCRRHLAKTANLMIHITDRCDLQCPVCLAAAGKPRTKEPTVAEIEAALPRLPAERRPNVCLIGGEPTLRQDLPEIVRAVVRQGYLPRLNTNGSRLARKPELIEALYDAGLRWIILQFDGMEDRAYEQLRDRPLRDEKLAVTDRLVRRGFKVQWAVMVAKGVNDDQLGRIVDAAFEHRVFWVSLYPAAATGRMGFEEETHLAETVAALQRTTAGRISERELHRAMQLFNLAHRLTGREVFRQKTVMLTTVLSGRAGEYQPFTRLLDPRVALRRPRDLLRLIRHLRAVLDFEHRELPEGIVFLTIKKFQAADALDLEEASDCNISWLVPGGVVAFDVFNACWRDRELWQGETAG